MRRSVRFSVVVGVTLAALAASPATAQAVEFTGRFSKWTPPENPKCTCRFKGQHLELGAQRCISTPDGPRLHECITVENVTSWKASKQPCPQAALITPMF